MPSVLFILNAVKRGETTAQEAMARSFDAMDGNIGAFHAVADHVLNLPPSEELFTALIFDFWLVKTTLNGHKKVGFFTILSHCSTFSACLLQNCP
jgi:hypothetical protein